MMIPNSVSFQMGGFARNELLGVGDVTFERPATLQAHVTLDGLVVAIPTTVRVFESEILKGTPLVSHLQAVVTCQQKEIGVATDNGLYHAGTERAGHLTLRLPAHTLAAVERLRNGGSVGFGFDVSGDACLLLDVEGRRGIRTGPERIGGKAQVVYETEAWVRMLTATGFGENVFVEIPLPRNPGPPWEEVWKALRTARDALNRGGTTAWKTTVSECRIALEKWEAIEAVDHGPGGLTANRNDREARTVDQRRDALRWHAHQLAHYFQHNHSDECTRDDAVLVLATLAGLLAVRKP